MRMHDTVYCDPESLSWRICTHLTLTWKMPRKPTKKSMTFIGNCSHFLAFPLKKVWNNSRIDSNLTKQIFFILSINIFNIVIDIIWMIIQFFTFFFLFQEKFDQIGGQISLFLKLILNSIIEWISFDWWSINFDIKIY